VRGGKRKARQPVARPRVSVERRRPRHAPVRINSGSQPGTGLPAGAAEGRSFSSWRGTFGFSWCVPSSVLVASSMPGGATPGRLVLPVCTCRSASPSACSPFAAHYRSGLLARCGWSDCGMWWGPGGWTLTCSGSATSGSRGPRRKWTASCGEYNSPGVNGGGSHEQFRSTQT
jgi:hypothetical protein